MFSVEEICSHGQLVGAETQKLSGDSSAIRMRSPSQTTQESMLGLTGVGKCPMTWEYWTSPKIVAI